MQKNVDRANATCYGKQMYGETGNVKTRMVSVSVSDPLPFVAVIDACVNAITVGVPEITPVDVLIVKPDGRAVAL
jgi:hypothetical protein